MIRMYNSGPKYWNEPVLAKYRNFLVYQNGQILLYSHDKNSIIINKDLGPSVVQFTCSNIWEGGTILELLFHVKIMNDHDSRPLTFLKQSNICEQVYLLPIFNFYHYLSQGLLFLCF